MNPWKITLKFSDGTNKELEMFDIQTYFGGYLKIKRSYFDSLVKSIKMTKKYFTKKAIYNVLAPDDEDWSLNPWMLIIVKDNEKKMPFWFLIKREKDLSGTLVAIGPKSFVEYNNNKSTESNREIKRLINYITVYVNKFDCIVLLPNFIL
ncbi:hypothetical protein LCGC14_0492800 [marine sediment metagenome]|uniref:Uncharacterized protein n=1 Tax=marine sediment metagenome TaxID=412755 RepID=A0A0F9SPH4_9ZZZZ|nr:MAG: hypothetical protein Lokiarch_50870 [Candidatus Lokiarchaeum sp. GC14_75]